MAVSAKAKSGVPSSCFQSRPNATTKCASGLSQREQFHTHCATYGGGTSSVIGAPHDLRANTVVVFHSHTEIDVSASGEQLAQPLGCHTTPGEVVDSDVSRS